MTTWPFDDREKRSPSCRSAPPRWLPERGPSASYHGPAVRDGDRAASHRDGV